MARNHCVNGDVTLAPGQSDNLCVELKRSSGDQLEGKLFGMRGYPVLLGGPGTVDPANVTQILLFVAEPSDEHVFEVSNLRASGRYTPPTAWTSDATPFFPFIDTFGNIGTRDWPGKTKSLADLAAKRHAEAAELASMPGPKEWDKYGAGNSGPLFQTDGFFRTQKSTANGGWWTRTDICSFPTALTASVMTSQHLSPDEKPGFRTSPVIALNLKDSSRKVMG